MLYFSWYIEWNSDPHGRFEVVADSDDVNQANVYQAEPLDFEIVQQRTMSLQVTFFENKYSLRVLHERP